MDDGCYIRPVRILDYRWRRIRIQGIWTRLYWSGASFHKEGTIKNSNLTNKDTIKQTIINKDGEVIERVIKRRGRK